MCNLKSRQTDRQNSSERRLLARIDIQCWPMLESIVDLRSLENTIGSLFTLVNSLRQSYHNGCFRRVFSQTNEHGSLRR